MSKEKKKPTVGTSWFGTGRVARGEIDQKTGERGKIVVVDGNRLPRVPLRQVAEPPLVYEEPGEE